MSYWTGNEFPFSFYSFCINGEIRLISVLVLEIRVRCFRFQFAQPLANAKPETKAV